MILGSFLEKKDRSTAAMYFLLGALWLSLLSFLVCPFFPRLMMEKFHLLLKPFPVWMATQLVPSMYNFENEIWISPDPLTPRMLSSPDSSRLGIFYSQVNHYPLRLITFNLRRGDFYPSQPGYVYLRSKYRANELVCEYSLRKTGDKVFLGQARKVLFPY